MGGWRILLRKPSEAGHTKTEAYIDNRSLLGASFRVKCFKESISTIASSPTSQLRSLGVFLGGVAYRRWNFRVSDVSRAVLN